MIYISQGHQFSIGLEILFKALLCLNPKSLEKFTLIAKAESLIATLESLKMKYSLNNQQITFGNQAFQLPFIEIDNNEKFPQDIPESSQSLLYALQIIKQEANKGNKKKTLLQTLPTSKDQPIYNGEMYKGHTELFREYFSNPYLPMVFHGPKLNLLLITDHIPLKNVTDKNILTAKLIQKKISMTLNSHQYYFTKISEVIIAGINPHAGEGGLLGDEESHIKTAITLLKRDFKKTCFYGPLSGDTLMFYKGSNPLKQLFVYMYHDQGLALFKSLYGTIGLNVTLGLPFLRLSVDHGTAFNLYGKNKANYLGALYMLQKALKITSKK